MTDIWRSTNSGLSIFAQTAPTTPTSTLTTPVTQGLNALGLGGLGSTVLNLIGGILILILGWIIAAIVSNVVKNLLKRTNVDNRIASYVAGQSGTNLRIERIIAGIVFWVIMLVAIVAFFDAIQLTTVSQPLNAFLNQVIGFLPRLGGAALLTVLAWVLATLAKTVVTRSAQSFGLDDRLASTREGFRADGPAGVVPPDDLSRGATTATVAPPAADNLPLLSDTLGNALYWFVFLFFLPLILNVLNLQGPLQPVQNLLNEILLALPRLLKAVIIGAIGWLLARIVRGIVTNLLSATGIDRVGTQFGLRRSTGSQSLSWLIGTIVYVLILIPAAIAALDALQISAISGPAVAMLNQVLSVIPQIFTAGLILVIAYAIARFVADLVRNLLASIGFDNVFQWLGVQSAPTTPPVEQEVSRPLPGYEMPPVEPAPLSARTPSEVAAIVVLVGIMLFATVAATNVLNIPAITAIVSGLLVVFGQVLAGLVVFAVGLYLANLAFNLITSSGNPQARILGQTARIAIIALVSAMALQQMGIAASIVNLAFGLLLGAVAVAIALAFGLGCRGIAAAQLEQWLAALNRRELPPR